MKEILNIVITGGPCGGKTTALDEITKFLRSYGYHIELVNESATELIDSGVKPFGEDGIDLELFQSILLDLQIAKEKARRVAAISNKCEKVAILYDRGILDNKSYITDEVFNKFLKERKMTEAEILSSYDIVCHLVTAAIGKEDYYTTINNSARTETKEEARERDLNTRNAWKNHPNLNIIGNDTLFNEKIEKVKNIIRAYLGEKEVIKKERYVVSLDDIYLDNKNRKIVREDIEEFILNYDNEESFVYTKNTIMESSYYTCSRNIFESNGSYRTICHTISKDEYRENLIKLKGVPIKEIRYNFIDDGERFRLTIYLLDDEQFAILERDVVNENRKDLPSFIRKATNITNNHNYSSDSIYVDYNIQKIFKKRR